MLESSSQLLDVPKKYASVHFVIEKSFMLQIKVQLECIAGDLRSVRNVLSIYSDVKMDRTSWKDSPTDTRTLEGILADALSMHSYTHR